MSALENKRVVHRHMPKHIQILSVMVRYIKGEPTHSLKILSTSTSRSLSLLNGDITCFHKIHEGFATRQHGVNLIKRDLASRCHSTDVKVGVLEGGKSTRKEAGKRGPIDISDTIASKLEADDQREMLERGKIL